MANVGLVNFARDEFKKNQSPAKKRVAKVDFRQERDTRRIKEVRRKITYTHNSDMKGADSTAPGIGQSTFHMGNDDDAMSVSSMEVAGPRYSAKKKLLKFLRKQQHDELLMQSSLYRETWQHQRKHRSKTPEKSQGSIIKGGQLEDRSITTIKDEGEEDGDGEVEKEKQDKLGMSLKDRMEMQDGLSGRDVTALKLGRMVLGTILDQPEVSTKDSISRFFFDNWLSKSGSNVQSADSFSIDLMSQLDKRISEAGASNESKDGANEENSQEEKGAPITPEEVSMNPYNCLDSEGIVLKSVGCIGLETFDKCISEFGQANPILTNIKNALLPTLFIDPRKVEALGHELMEGTELEGTKYAGYETWFERSEQLYQEVCDREEEKQGLIEDIASLQDTMTSLNGDLRAMKAELNPVKRSLHESQRRNETLEGLITQHKEHIDTLQRAHDEKHELLEQSRKDHKMAINREKAKENDIKVHQETIAQMIRDKLPDIRPQYAAAQKEIEVLKQDNADLEQALRNFKIMLEMQNKTNAECEISLTQEAADFEALKEELNRVGAMTSEGEGEKCQEGDIVDEDSSNALMSSTPVDNNDDIDDEGKQYSMDEITSMKLRFERMNPFFADNARSLDFSRYIEFLQHLRQTHEADIEQGNRLKTALRTELQTARDCEQQLNDSYQMAAEETNNKHVVFVEELQRQHLIEIHELTAQIDDLKAEIVLKDELMASLQEQLTKAKQEIGTLTKQLRDAVSAKLIAEEKAGQLASQMVEMEGQMKRIEEEMAETKKELGQALADILALKDGLKTMTEKYNESNNIVGMVQQDQLLQDKYDKVYVKCNQLDSQLKFAQNDVKNLNMKNNLLTDEVKELTGEVKDLTTTLDSERQQFSEEKQLLEIDIMKKGKKIQVLENKVVAVYEQDIARYESAVAWYAREVTKLSAIIATLTIEKENLLKENDNLLKRALVAEEHYRGSDQLAEYVDNQLRSILGEMGKHQDTNSFEYDDDLRTADDILVDIEQLVHGCKLERGLQQKAIDVVAFADTTVRSTTEKFRKAISKLEHSLSMSRAVIEETRSLVEESQSLAEGSHASGSVYATDDGSIAGSVVPGEMAFSSSPGHVMNMTPAMMGSMTGGAAGDSNSHVTLLPEGWLTYNPEKFTLHEKGSVVINNEILLMMQNDHHETLQHRDHIMEHIIGHVEETRQEAQRKEEEAVIAAKEEAKRDAEQNVNKTAQIILNSAATAVESENPLRMRVAQLTEELQELEESNHELKLEHSEMVMELEDTRSRFQAEEDNRKKAEAALDVMRSRFEQSMRANAESTQELDILRAKEAERNAPMHPALSLSDLNQKSKGNPKRLLQPFLNYIRRNENEVSRQLGQNTILMREAKRLCEVVLENLQVVENEEAQFYHRRHQSADDNARNVASLQKIWEKVNATKSTVKEHLEWVFETLDFSMGATKIHDALKPPPYSKVDPTRAIGDNHMAASYESKVADIQGEVTDAQLAELGLEVEEGESKEELVGELKYSLEAIVEKVRLDASKYGGWRTELYNLDGTINIDMSITDWGPEDQIKIMKTKLMYVQALRQQEKKESETVLNKWKEMKGKSDSTCDALQDKLDDLQKEYGAKGIDHDFHVYLRIKNGILDGSLAEHNLPEVIYKPQDFIDIENAVYKTVETILGLCQTDNDNARPSTGTIAAHDVPAHSRPSTMGGRLGVKSTTTEITPAGDRAPSILDSTPYGLRASHMVKQVRRGGKLPHMTTGSVAGEPSLENSASTVSIGNKAGRPTSPVTAEHVMATSFSNPNLPKHKGVHKSLTRGPANEWKANIESKKRTKLLKKHRIASIPASARVDPSNNNAVEKNSDVKPIDHAHSSENIEDFEWSSDKTKALVNLLDEACNKINMRVLYAKAFEENEGGLEQESTTITGGGPNDTDVTTFMRKMNSKVNKHILNAKVLDGVVKEIEQLHRGRAEVSMTEIKHIYESKVGSDPQESTADMFSLTIEKPPAALARSAHLVRDDHHHLVKEEKVNREFLSRTWQGAPRSGNEVFLEDLFNAQRDIPKGRPGSGSFSFAGSQILDPRGAVRAGPGKKTQQRGSTAPLNMSYQTLPARGYTNIVPEDAMVVDLAGKRTEDLYVEHPLRSLSPEAIGANGANEVDNMQSMHPEPNAQKRSNRSVDNRTGTTVVIPREARQSLESLESLNDSLATPRMRRASSVGASEDNIPDDDIDNNSNVSVGFPSSPSPPTEKTILTVEMRQ